MIIRAAAVRENYSMNDSERFMEQWSDMATSVAARYGLSPNEVDVSVYGMFSEDDLRCICDLALIFKKNPWDICHGLDKMAGDAQVGLDLIKHYLIETPQ